MKTLGIGLIVAAVATTGAVSFSVHHARKSATVRLETKSPRPIDAKGATARYVRLYSNGNSTNSGNHYIEVEVYGKPLRN